MNGKHFWMRFAAVPERWQCVHCDDVDYGTNQPTPEGCEFADERAWYSGIVWTVAGSFGGLFVAFVIITIWERLIK